MFPDTGRLIDSWLMSCRAIGRSVEEFFFGCLLERCRALGYQQIIGEYIPTSKNHVVAPLYEKLGFHSIDNWSVQAERFGLNVAGARNPPTFVALAS
jgi:predicted enzyme involved in methoxymalonyl-ACP biosynthesis